MITREINDNKYNVWGKQQRSKKDSKMRGTHIQGEERETEREKEKMLG